MSLALFGSTQSASFECNFVYEKWDSILGKIYWCKVQNAVNITSHDVAVVDDVSGAHKSGYNSYNVEGFSFTKGPIYYFPRGLNKFFTNLRGISIYNTGLKEVHQSELRDFPKLESLWLYTSNLEVIEENLFEFNPNLEFISLHTDKISHIDPNVFDKLTKLKYLYLVSNICIDMKAENNPTKLQNVITAAKAQCISSEYLNLEQKFRNLKNNNLNSENFKQQIEKFENEVKNSKFSNTFYQRIQDLKIDLIAKKESEFVAKIAALIMVNVNQMSTALESKINDKLAVQGKIMSEIQGNLTRNSDAITTINKNYENFKLKFLALIKEIEKIYM